MSPTAHCLGYVWQVIVINVKDAQAPSVNSLADVERVFPGEVDKIREWFTWYKAIDPKTGEKKPGAEPNVFGFDGKPLGTEATWGVIREAHGTWFQLISRQVKAGKRKLA